MNPAPDTPGPPTHLRVEQLENPLGLDAARPRLAWWVNDPGTGAVQSAYQVQAATDPAAPGRGEADAWDSGQVQSDQSIHVPYAGQALRPATRYHWRVRTWDAHGQASPWSEPAWWETGLHVAEPHPPHALRDAQWIGGDAVGDQQRSAPCPQLRKQLALNGVVASARLYITGLGLYDANINGQPVTDEALSPGWTDYHTRVTYRTYDVTALLQTGGNAVGITLGDGWYAGHIAWCGRQLYGDRPRVNALLQVAFGDGRTQTIVTDATWRTAPGHIIAADLYMGEHHDLRQATPGWCNPAFDDHGWAHATVFDPPSCAVEAASYPAIRPIKQLAPVAEPTTIDDAGVSVQLFDLGQNMVGRARVTLRGKPGQTARLRFGEMLQKDGRLYTENLRKAKATDHITFADDRPVTFETSFTFHGFRYVEISGCAPVGRDDVVGVVLCSDLEHTGSFECSHGLVNRLRSNILWGQRGNFLDVPTDCPQRDERLGWTGDAQVFVRTAAFNMNVAPFFAKWQRDLEDAQQDTGSIPAVAPIVGRGLSAQIQTDGGPAWADAVVICPWTMYRCFGDTRILEAHYPGMCRFIDHLADTADDHIRTARGFAGWHGYGDWLATDAVQPWTAPTPRDLIGTAYFAHDLALMADIATALGKEDDATRFVALHEQVVAAFNRAFVTDAGRVVGDTQTGYLLALGFDLLPEDKRPAALAQLKHLIASRGPALSTGFVGTPLLCPVLSRFGEHDLAYQLLLREDYPGWLYSIHQGATTMWERWNSYTHKHGFGPVGMNSFNHYAYGAIGQWLYATVAGLDLDPDAPAFKRLRIAPVPHEKMTHAKASLDTPYGRASTDWRVSDGRFLLDLTIPANTCAQVRLPNGESHEVGAGAHRYDVAMP